ncbi:L,D-transpeptidase family protein [Brunnivagina elsteri]|uniref:L,D-transpeptidase family protein n=1 Tax=Brunnivagina elsteri TaxID=1247191 RepID=UPI001FE66A1B|nr:L,D-transpeptidase [Calothrix elsteri]
MTEIPAVLCIGGCRTQSAFHIPLQESQFLNDNQVLNKLINEPIDKSKTSILIEKSQHRLTLYYKKKPIKSYTVVFGKNSQGDKFYEGDYRTPEGILRIKDLYPHPKWSKFMWLDYPNTASWKKHLQEKTQGYINFFLPIGGEVGIHGVPQGSDEIIDKRENWTWGCPSLKNKDVDEIYEVVQKRTLVEILP